MLETYADRPSTTQLTVKCDFVHSEIGARADLRMDKVELVEKSVFSLDPLNRLGTTFNIVEVNREPKPGTGRDLGRAVGGHSHLRDNHIALEITGAGGDVAGQREPRQAGQRQVMRAAHA